LESGNILEELGTVGKGQNLGEFEQMVMLAIIRLDDNAYGMEVRLELSTTAGREVSIGTVYGTLERLEEKGYVSSWRADPEAVRGGRARRYFVIEEAGQEALVRSRKMLASMWRGVSLSDGTAPSA
jgi:PadR family transcriptional regulator PadR